MIRVILGAVLLVLSLAAVPQASAASFDCSKAVTAFEHAICDNPSLSQADDTLAIAFATATGGLSKKAEAQLRADQHDWLDYAAKSCTDDGALLADTARYTTEQSNCLATAFSTRIGELEQSRMLGGHRFTIAGSVNTLPDPDAANDPDYFWKVATHTVSYSQLDGEDKLAPAFNAAIKAVVTDATTDTQTDGNTALDPHSDSDLAITLVEALDGRFSLKMNTFWYGHGAAHGDYAISYLHYLPAQQRMLAPEDVFTGADWQKKLADLSLAELKKEHGEWLQLEDNSDITGIVENPSRWSFDNEYGLTIQFEPYEVSAYAYGTPTILVTWDSLSDILSPDVDTVRYGN